MKHHFKTAHGKVLGEIDRTAKTAHGEITIKVVCAISSNDDDHAARIARRVSGLTDELADVVGTYADGDALDVFLLD